MHGRDGKSYAESPFPNICYLHKLVYWSTCNKKWDFMSPSQVNVPFLFPRVLRKKIIIPLGHYFNVFWVNRKGTLVKNSLYIVS